MCARARSRIGTERNGKSMHACSEETERAMTINEITRLLGPFNDAGTATVLAALEQNPDGCLTLAHRVAGRSGVNNPPGLYLRCLAAGEHLEQPTRTTGPRHYPGLIPAPMTPEKIEHNKRLAPLLRRIVELRAHQHLRQAMTANPGAPLIDLMQSVVEEREAAATNATIRAHAPDPMEA